ALPIFAVFGSHRVHEGLNARPIPDVKRQPAAAELLDDGHQPILATGAEDHAEAGADQTSRGRLADPGTGSGDHRDAVGIRHSLMVGGPARFTICSFSVTVGILFAGESRQQARGRHGPAPAWSA